MIYSRVYRKLYPFQPDTDVATLEEKDRELLVKCLRQFPRFLNAWVIEALHDTNPRSLDGFQFGSDLDDLRKRYSSLADKITAGQSLSEEETAAVNLALCGSKYNIVASFLVPVRSHVMRLYLESKRYIQNNNECTEEKVQEEEDPFPERNVYCVFKANNFSEFRDFIEGKYAFHIKIVSITQNGDSYTVVYFFK